MQKGLIGAKLGHSFSKTIHEKIGNYRYDLIELSETEVIEFLQKRDFSAINVTVPYKKMVMDYVDVISQKCKVIGSCNTIINRNQKLYAYNTDYDGFKYMLAKHDINFDNKKIIVLGNGGAAAAIKAVINEYNFEYLIFCKNNPSAETITYEKLYTQYTDAEVIINTSPVGMFPDNYADLIDLSVFKKLSLVIDIIYNPLNTKLLVATRELNIKAVGGFEMLVAQAVYAYQYFNETIVPLEKIEKIYQEILDTKTNYVLIGMPGCGKSTIANKLSRLLNKNVVDIDEQIESTTKMSIKEYINKYSEPNFRKIETKITRVVAKSSNIIIATGGGIVLDHENILALKQNGILIYIDRDVDKLAITTTRPLSKNLDNLRQLYLQRKQLYHESADYIIDNNESIEKCIQQIVEIKEKKNDYNT